jgi:hypothetical protein
MSSFFSSAFTNLQNITNIYKLIYKLYKNMLFNKVLNAKTESILKTHEHYN